MPVELVKMLLPPASLILLAFIAALVSCTRFRRSGLALTLSCLAILLLLSTEAVTRMLVATLEHRVRPLSRVQEAGNEAIVVLGAGTMAATPEYHSLVPAPDATGLERARYAAYLQRLTGLPILATGGFGTGQALALALQVDYGVPVKWVETASHNTAENASASAALLKTSRHRPSILLVTDAMSMPRATLAFSACGFDVTPAPTLFFAQHPLTLEHFLPSTQALSRAHTALYELAALALYRWRGNTCGGAAMEDPS